MHTCFSPSFKMALNGATIAYKNFICKVSRGEGGWLARGQVASFSIKNLILKLEL